MNRIDACNALISQLSGTTYLEIGVAQGNVITKIDARRRLGVDPSPKPSSLEKQADIIYFEMPSDQFFSHHAVQLFTDSPVDVALIDGLHEYRQALRDVDNVLKYLAPGGVIIMHDCNPLTAVAGLPPADRAAYEQHRKEQTTFQPNGPWEGDVWKAIVSIRSTRKDLKVFVLDCDHGLGFVTRGTPDSSLDYSAGDIDSLTFAEFDANRSSLINLKQPSYFEKFQAQLSNQRS
ncbi:MAG: hypothetical protein C1943_06585 [Halochromatium sp.]|nr:hypothetical protein [Halochromatium sp.]